MRLISATHMGLSANAFGLADTEQKFPLGLRMIGVSHDQTNVANVLAAGGGEFVYCQVTGAVPCGTPVSFDSLTWTVTALAATANASVAVGVFQNRATATGQFGWVQVAGQGPIVTNGTFAAGANVFKQAAGVASTTVGAGLQILGMRSIVAQAATFTKTLCKTLNGSLVVKVPNTDGIFAGITVSGTGIPASTEIDDIDVGGNTMTMNNAATANGTVTVTFTYTSVGGVMMNYPHGQGQIT